MLVSQNVSPRMILIFSHSDAIFKRVRIGLIADVNSYCTPHSPYICAYQ